MESIEIEGTSIEEAVERACDALNTTSQNLEYDILPPQEGKQTGRKIKILARKREEADSTAPLSAFGTQVKTILEAILKKIDSIYIVSAFEYPDKLVLNIKGDGSGLLIGKRGQTLDALQHILIKIIQKSEGEGERNSKKIIIDTEKYREKKIEYLKDLAHKLADKVKQTGRPVAVNPMSSYERRIVHLALEKEEGVYTESLGEGLDRQVMIMPKNSKSGAKRS
jgi:spoIIIJ-associated protein